MHKIKDCHVVPWYNSAEWLKVYEDLADSTSNKEYALNTLLIWKARSPSLPSGIESTLPLLLVQAEDRKSNQETVNIELLRLAYSTAIMRFVNHMLDTETMKGNSLYTAAKNVEIPDWIVDIRHDAAHGKNLPSITLLREACSMSLQWLQENYWDKYKLQIRDFTTGQGEIQDENRITILIDLCTTLSVCAHPYCKIKNLSHIPDSEMRESITNNVNELFGSQVNMSNPKAVSITSLIKIVCDQRLLKIKKFSNYIIKLLLGEDSLFLSQDLLYRFSASDFKYKNKLHNNYVQCFEVLLMFLHRNDLLLNFIMGLIKITQDTKTQHFKARLSAMWVSEILVALKRSQLFSSKVKKMTAVQKRPRKIKDIKQLYYHWFPSIKGKNLMLDYKRPIPKQLLDLNYIKPIISYYNPYLVYFIRNLLDLVEPRLPSDVNQRLYKVAELISNPDKFTDKSGNPPSPTIYTADDIKSGSEDDDIEIIEDIETPKEDNTTSNKNNQLINNSIWVLASKDHDWASCPIGVLPWQQQNGTL